MRRFRLDSQSHLPLHIFFSLSFFFIFSSSSWTSLSRQPIFFVSAQSQGNCSYTKIQRDPYRHKSSYTVAVHAVRGFDITVQEVHTVFSDYLTATAGQKFDPPIQFEMLPLGYSELIPKIENDEIDFLYSNPGVYSCIGTQVGATALATVVKSAVVRGRHYDLDVYGGVMAVRYDNNAINSIRDLKGKIIAAGGIVDLMGGQMQVYEMENAGMSYVNDPKQVVFTNNQYDIVLGVIDGSFDVGFVRTNQIEVTTDTHGVLVDPDLFKILEPKTYIMESGELFPFLHSTHILPQWPFAAMPNVASDVQEAVQIALMDLGYYVLMGQLQECSTTSLNQNQSDWCNELALKATALRTPCDATEDLVQLALEASQKSQISSFRTALSYFKLRTIQQEAGFLVQDEDGWRCTTPDDVYEGITCPEGFFKRNRAEFTNGCTQKKLSCNRDKGYECFCQPCVRAYEVDVYHLEDWENDPHIIDSYYEAFPACKKMEICGKVEQRKSIQMRIFDNLMRDGVNVSVTVNSGEGRYTIIPKNVPKTYAYDFNITDNKAQVQVIDILFNGEAISQSPIRVMVVDADCSAQYGNGSHRVPDPNGFCVCAGDTYEMGGNCLTSASFFIIVFSIVFAFVGIILFFYLGYKKNQSDSVWHINVDELHFNEPPEVIGVGGFGVVILGDYRGTKVAVKRVLPPSKLSKGQSGSIDSGDKTGGESAETVGNTSNDNKAARRASTTVNETKKSGQVW